MHEPRVQHVITTLDIGGAEMHLLSLCGGLAARGLSMRVAYLKGEGTLRGEFERRGVPVDHVAMAHLASAPAAAGRLASLFRRVRPDIVHTHLLKADAAGALAACLARVPHLLSSKHNAEAALSHPVVARLHGWLSLLPERILVLSDHVREHVVTVGRAPSKRIERIHYGLDVAGWDARAEVPSARPLREELGIDDGCWLLAVIARLAPQKGHPVLLDAIRSARKDLPPFLLAIIGDDPFGDGRARLEEEVRKRSLQDVVRFLGIRRDLPWLLPQVDAVVLPSLWEGLGLVLLEAMAARRVVIASRVGGIPEVVEDGVTGILVPPGEPQPLARSLLGLSRDAEGSRGMGLAGRARVKERFGLSRMLDRYEDLYRRLTGKPARGGEGDGGPCPATGAREMPGGGAGEKR